MAENWWDSDEFVREAPTTSASTAPAPASQNWWDSDEFSTTDPSAPAPVAPVNDERPGVGTLIGRGIDQLQGMGYGAVEAVGEAVGSDAAADWGREGREFNNKQMAEGPQNQDFWEIDSVGDAWAFAKESVVQNLPQMGVSMGGGLAGAAAGAAGGPVGMAVGGFLGAMVPNFALALGEIQGTVKDKDPNAAPSGWTWAGATAMAALDSALPGKIGSTLRRTFGKEVAEEAAKTFLTANIKTEALKALGTEGLTEAMQSVVAEAAAAQATGQEIDQDWWKNAIAEGVAGALVGGTVGGAAAGVSELARPKAQANDAPLDEVTAPADIPVIPDEEYDSPRLTPEDRASPLPNQMIDEGKAAAEAMTSPLSAPVTPEPVPAAERALLRKFGETDEDIDLMSAPERVANIDRAKRDGTTVTQIDVDRARSYALPDPVRMDGQTQTSQTSPLPETTIPERGMERAPQGVPATPAPANPEIAVSVAPEGKESWSAFPPSAGSLNIPRAEMPQIKSGDRSALAQFLKARGVQYGGGTVDPRSLKPTQAEYSPEKAKQAAEFTGTDRAILISSDNRIIDGHHQWIAARKKGEPISVLRLDAPAEKVLPLVKQFPSATFADGATKAQPEKGDTQKADTVSAPRSKLAQKAAEVRARKAEDAARGTDTPAPQASVRTPNADQPTSGDNDTPASLLDETTFRGRDQGEGPSRGQDRGGADEPSFSRRVTAPKEPPSVRLMSEPLKIDGKVKVQSIADGLTNLHMDTYGRKLFPEDSDADYSVVLDTATMELGDQLQRPNSGEGWYSKDTSLAISQTAKVYPEILTSDGRSLYLTSAGIFSNGLTPEQAWLTSAEAFEYWVETGQIPIERGDAARVLGREPKATTYKKDGKVVIKDAGWSPRNAANVMHLKLLDTIVKSQGGLTEAIRWLTSPQPRTDINQAMLDSGMTNPRFTTKAEREGPDTWGALVFGEKLGRYTIGLHGVEISSEDTTVDLWYTRTYRRWTGRLFDKPLGKEGIAAQPDPARGDLERKTIFRLTGDLASKFDLPPGDVQAMLWFYEKRLWGAQGLRTDEGTNSAGAKQLLESRGLSADDGGRGSQARDVSQGRPGAASESPAFSRSSRAGKQSQGRSEYQPSFSLGQQIEVDRGSRQDLRGLRGRGRGQGAEARQAEGRPADGFSKQPVTAADLDRLDDPTFLSLFLKRPGWGVVTATRGPSDFITSKEDGPLKTSLLQRHEKENAERHKRLRSILKRRGIPYVELDGVYEGVSDGTSYLIIADEATTLALGREFDQDSILTRDGLVFARRERPDVRSSGDVMIGEQARSEEFYSVTPGGTSFSMGLGFGKSGPGVPVIPAGYTTDPARPQLPINAEGMVELHHWSSKPLTVVDPAFKGTGPLRGPEIRRGSRLSFFGINPRSSMRTPGTGYVKEAGLGSIEHIALVDPSRLYPYMEDPEGLVRDRDISAAEDAIRDAGYIGYYSTDNGSGDAPLGNVAALFEAIPVQRKGTTDEASFQRRTRDRAGGPQGGSRAPLAGAPQVQGASGPDERLNAVAEGYARSIGINLRRQAEYVSVDPARAARIAQAYEQMEHAPNDPVVREAFQNLIRQTRAQYDALVGAGYQFFFIDEQNDLYGGNPWNAMRDLRANQRMGVFPTEAGFGSGPTNANLSGNPLEADTGIEWGVGFPDGPKKRVLANDLFRAVHDAFGHGMEGSGFRADGEENAWQAHVRLFTGSAVAAITTETRGQNSWLNFGPHGEKNKTAKVEDTIFADQKTGLMPEWTWTEGRVGDMDGPSFKRTARITDQAGGVETTIELTEDFLAEATSVGQRLRKELDRLGLTDISLRISERMTAMINGENWEVDGRYLRKMIDVALTSGDRLNTMNHEVIHAMKALGLFSDKEWAILERKAEKEWLARYDIKRRYDNIGPAKQREEGIAQAFADWMSGTKFDGIIAKSFRKIRDMMEALGNGLRGQGFRSLNGIFKDIQSGRIGNRERGFNRMAPKSATERLREAFSIAATERRPVFYSPLVRALEGAKQKSATAEDWKSIMSKLPGVKAVELEWIGVNDWLDSQTGQISREDLQTYVNENQLEVTTEQLAGDAREGDGTYTASDVRVEADQAIYPDDWADEAEMYLDEAREELEADLEDGETVDDEAVQDRAEQMAQEAYEPYEYTARVRTRDGEHTLNGYYNSDDQTFFFRELSDDEINQNDIEELMVEYVNGLNSAETTDGTIPTVGAGKFGGYTESGGDNYREILLRMPNLDQQGKNKPKAIETGPFAQEPLGEARPFVNDSHFPQPNIVVHARVKDRQAGDKKVMFVEEIQSDLGSEWRKIEISEKSEGRRKELKDRLEKLDERGVMLIEEVQKLIGQNIETNEGFRLATAVDGFVLTETFLMRIADGKALRVDNRLDREMSEELDASPDALAAASEFKTVREELNSVQEELYALPRRATASPSLPQTPFLNENYYAIMVKRLLREAVDNGYNRLAWTPGYMQARRWDKAAQSVVESVSWKDYGMGKVVKMQMSEGVENKVVLNDDGTMRTWNGEERPNITGKPLSALLGEKAKDILGKPEGKFSGDKITFANSGYAVAYDVQIKKAVEKLTKRYGVKVESDTSMPDFREPDDPARDGDLKEDAFRSYLENKSEQEMADVALAALTERFGAAQAQQRWEEAISNRMTSELDSPTRVEAIRDAVAAAHRTLSPLFEDFQFTPPQPKGEAVWSVEITPEMVQDIQQGLPMFQGMKQTATEAFKRWFGDSKVVDENGQPLVVYHGTTGRELDRFDPNAKGKTSILFSVIDTHRQGFYFAEKEGFAAGFAEQGGRRGGAVMQVYLSIQNPLDVTSTDNASVARLRAVVERMQEIDPEINNPDFIIGRAGYDDFWELLDTDEGGDVLVQAARDLGYDGIKMIEVDLETSDPDYRPSGEGAVTWVAFDNTQIKSATGNNGNFDPNDDRIAFSLGKKISDAGKMVASEFVKGAKTRNPIDRPTAEDGETLDPYIHRKLIDRYDPISRLVKSLGPKIADALDPYLQARLYDDTTRIKIQKMYDAFLQPALDELVKFGAELKDLHEYLYALHAEERNRVVGLRNPVGSQFYKAVSDPRLVGASGMSTNDARAILSRVNGAAQNGDARSAAVRRAAKNIRQMLDQSLSAQLASGLIDGQVYDLLTNQWKNYVPMKNDDGLDPSGNWMPTAGKGFDIRGKEFEAATGSFSEADNVILHAAKQAVRAQERMGKNEVGKSVLRMLNKYDPTGTKIAQVYWSDEPQALGNIVKAQQIKRRTLDASGKVVWTSMPNPFTTASDVLATKVGGRVYYIKFNDPKIGNALKTLHQEPLGMTMSLLSRVSNWQSIINTRMNPAFTPINIIRDLWTGYASLGAFGFTNAERRAVVGNFGRAMMAMGRNVFGKAGTTAEQQRWDGIVADFISDGGKISFDNYQDLTKDVDALEKSITRAAQISRGGMTAKQRGVEAFWSFVAIIEKLNDAGENALRIAVYQKAREKGVSRQRSAFMARDITVDFKKKGELGSEMNAAYVFFNSALQGNYNLAKRMGASKAVQAAATKFLIAGVGMAVINSMMAGEDEDGEDYYTKMLKEKPWVLERNLVLFTGGGNYVSVPLPFGFNAFVNIGTQLHAAATGVVSPLDAITSITRVTVDSFNPMGSGSLLSMAAPTIADPIIDIATNTNFAGNPIRPTENQFDPAPPPDAEQAFKSTNPIFVWWAQAMNKTFGGDEVQSSWADVYPDNLEHLWGFLTGGVGRFIAQIGGTGARAVDGEFEPSNTPYVRSFVGSIDADTLRGQYFSIRADAQEAKAQLKDYIARGDKAEIAAYKSSRAVDLKAVAVVDAVEKVRRKLNKQRKFLEKQNPPDLEDRLKKLDELEAQQMLRARKAYIQALQSQ